MRRLLCSLLSAWAAIQVAGAQAQPFRAGITRLAVEDTTPFEALVAYPTHSAESPVEIGPFALVASPDALPARPDAGTRFPMVLFSHGSGRGPGTPLVHRQLLLHLAREGFIVVAPFHPGTPRPFVDRPRQVRRALDAALADARFTPHADPARLGMIGFSFGGAVTLLSAGGALDLAHLSTYCREHPEDVRACEGVATDGSLSEIPARRSADALALKALVLLEPFGAPFQRSGLAAVGMPVLIYQALQSDLRPEGNAQALARALPRPPASAAVPGGHFVFVDPCPPALAAQARQLCVDPPGIDRPGLHRDLRPAISEFLRRNLL
jgi:predicted dienelactone hydrolase